MVDRPTELDLMLDAIDEAFKAEIVQFSKNAAEALEQIDLKEQGKRVEDINKGVVLVRRARRFMIAAATDAAKS